MTQSYIPTRLCDTTLLGTTASLNLISPSPPSCFTDSSVTQSSGPTVGNTGNGNSASVVAAVVVTILLLLIISVIVISVLIVITYKRRNEVSRNPEGRDAFFASSVYSDVTPNGKGENEIHNLCNPNYQSKGTIKIITYSCHA